MATTTGAEVAATLEQLRAQLAELTRRIEALEPATAPAAARAEAAQPEAPQPAITEEELLAISAALAAYLGVRPHIRQIRLLSTTAWAQQGRVSIQASHRLQG
ncbi:MAG TPA: hypothetical protein VMS37_32610 [Verrucomicrobiae bacterium]|nr:hypothetical protein [Verrucomicrobiae bacterium]